MALPTAWTAAHFISLPRPAPAVESIDSHQPKTRRQAADAASSSIGSERSWALAVSSALAAQVFAARRRFQRGKKTFLGHAAKQVLPVEAGLSAVVPRFETIRTDFPALEQEVRPEVPLVYLDSAATSQKPVQVLRELERFYSEDNSNVHRGTHSLSLRSTEAFEGARAKVARFINAADAAEVIFTRNATEAINLVALSWARANVHAGDEIVLTVMEHHSNIVPWQMLANANGAHLRFVGLTPDGMLDQAGLQSLISPRTKLVSLSHVSNVLGCTSPVEWVAERAHAVGAKVLLDACQSVPHRPLDVQKLGADWIAASGHKMCGPSGVGFLWGRGELLRASPPFMGGGEMIDQVSLQSSTYADIPHKFEAGTPAIAEAVALGLACDYLSALGMEEVQRHEQILAEHMWHRLRELPGIRLYGPPPELCPDRAALASFNIEGCHPHDLATLVDQDQGVAIRAGHHCCQPLHEELGISASARISAYIYNSTEEIDIAVDALKRAADMLRGNLGDLDLLADLEMASSMVPDPT